MMLLSALVAIRTYILQEQDAATLQNTTCKNTRKEKTLSKFYADEPLWLLVGEMVHPTCKHMLTRM